MKIINIAILAHVDAGKTSLTESLLSTSMNKEVLGSVDKGTTTTDTDALEKKRGISIYTATTSITVGDCKINIIDTPGHMDFIHEVEQALIATDLAILVVAANDGGIKSQTRKLYNTLRELEIPIIIFVNKIDIGGALVESQINSIKELTHNRAAMAENTSEVIDVLTLHDDAFLEHVLNESVTDDIYKRAWTQSVRNGNFVPIVKGSAIQLIGISSLIHMIETLSSDKNSLDELSSIVYKKAYNNLGKIQTYLRVFSGRIMKQERFVINQTMIKVCKLWILENGRLIETNTVNSGDIAIVEGFDILKIGEWLGDPNKTKVMPIWSKGQFKASLEYEKGTRRKVLEALNKMMEVNPFLEYEIDDITREINLILVGEVQKEVIEDTLNENYQCKVLLGPVSVKNKMTPTGCVDEVVIMNTIENSNWATMRFKLDPLPCGAGFNYETKINTGYLRQSFQNAIVESLNRLAYTPYKGKLITDFKLTLTAAEFASPVSTPSDFRSATEVLYHKIMRQVEFVELEPVGKFVLRIPESALKQAYRELAGIFATIQSTEYEGEMVVIRGEMYLKYSINYQQKVIAYTNGFGVFDIENISYQSLISF
ncbi:MAG: GTP-binding protein [Erysipelothrix sp.]